MGSRSAAARAKETSVTSELMLDAAEAGLKNQASLYRQFPEKHVLSCEGEAQVR